MRKNNCSVIKTWFVSSPFQHTSSQWVDLVLIGLIALLVRGYQLSSVPAGLNRDAAANGLYALDLLQRGIWPFFVLHMGVAEPMMVYLQSISIALLGSSVVALRIVSVIVGAATPCALYAFTRVWWPADLEDWRRYGALIAALGLALCPQHIHVSRMGLRAILFPLFQLISLTAFLHGWQQNKTWAWILTGITLGLGIYTYIAFRAIYLLVFLVCLILVWQERAQLRTRWRGLAIMFGCAFLTVAPAIPFFMRFPAALWGRAQQVTLGKLALVAEIGMLRVIGIKVWAQISMLFAPWPGQYNEMGLALLDPLLLVALGIGIITAGAHMRRFSSWLVILAIPIALLPSLLTSSLQPHGLRELGVLPFIFLLIALGNVQTARWLSRHWARIPFRLSHWILAFLLMLPSGMRIGRYFTYWHTLAPISENDMVLYNLTDVAEAEFLRHTNLPVLLPLAEYERSVLRYLSGDAFPIHQSALDEQGRLRPDLFQGKLVLLMPHDPDRKRLEGPTFTYDPAQYALLKDGIAYTLPPLDTLGKAALADRLPGSAFDLVYDTQGQSVATIYHLENPALSFVIQVEQLSNRRFADQVSLIGYTLSDWRLQPGGETTLTLYWQAQQKIHQDYHLFVHLLNREGAVLVFGDTVPGQGTYPTTYWDIDERVATLHRLPTPADLPPGRYEIEIGLFNLLNGARLALIGKDGREQGTPIVIGPLKVALPQPVDAPTNREKWQAVRFDLDQAISLIGYELNGQKPGEWQAHPGDVLILQLLWQANTRINVDYTCFVHLASADERILTQYDAPPLKGRYPTGIWEQNEQVMDQIDLAVPNEIVPGRYRLWAGMYNPLDTVRLSATGADGQRLPNDRILLGEIEIGEAQ